MLYAMLYDATSSYELMISPESVFLGIVISFRETPILYTVATTDMTTQGPGEASHKRTKKEKEPATS